MFTMSSFPVCSFDKYSSTVKSRLFPRKCKILIQSGTRKSMKQLFVNELNSLMSKLKKIILKTDSEVFLSKYYLLV